MRSVMRIENDLCETYRPRCSIKFCTPHAVDVQDEDFLAFCCNWLLDAHFDGICVLQLNARGVD